MMNNDQKIPCQVCNTPVPFDTHQFLQGIKFSCPNPNCDAVYGLPQSSHQIVKGAMDHLDELKTQTK